MKVFPWVQLSIVLAPGFAIFNPSVPSVGTPFINYYTTTCTYYCNRMILLVVGGGEHKKTSTLSVCLSVLCSQYPPRSPKILTLWRSKYNICAFFSRHYNPPTCFCSSIVYFIDGNTKVEKSWNLRTRTKVLRTKCEKCGGLTSNIASMS